MDNFFDFLGFIGALIMCALAVAWVSFLIWGGVQLIQILDRAVS